MPCMSRRTFAAGVSATAVLPIAPAGAQSAAAYPEKPIKMVVPYPPGGGSDFIGRLIAQKMSEGLGQTVIIDNRPGAGTTIGNDVVAKAAPDGYTLLQVNRDMGIGPSLYAALPYDTLKGFAWIGNAADGPFVLVVNPSVEARTLSEFAALAKAKPGALTYGCLVGGIAHLNVEALKQRLAIDILHVPYKGAGPSLTATVSGEITATLSSLTGAIPFVRGGQLRALAVGGAERAPALPDVPTVGEAGGGRDTVLPTFCGLAAPAGTPQRIIDRLSAELGRVVALPEVAAKIIEGGFIPAFSTPDAFAATITRDVGHFTKLVQSIGLTPQ